ncbi:MAG: hypothetical protein V4488_11560 [Pseudomonadota bacterium]
MNANHAAQKTKNNLALQLAGISVPYEVPIPPKYTIDTRQIALIDGIDQFVPFAKRQADS